MCFLKIAIRPSSRFFVQFFVPPGLKNAEQWTEHNGNTDGTSQPQSSSIWHVACVFFLVASVPQNPQIHGHKKNVKMRFKTRLNHEITVRTPHFDWDRPNLIYLKVACFRSQKWVLSQLCHIQIVKHPGKKHTKIIDQYTEITYYPSLSFSLSIIIIIHP